MGGILVRIRGQSWAWWKHVIGKNAAVPDLDDPGILCVVLGRRHSVGAPKEVPVVVDHARFVHEAKHRAHDGEEPVLSVVV